MLVRNTAGRRQLAVIDTADLTKFKVVAGFAEFDIAGHWADSKSLVFSLGDETAVRLRTARHRASTRSAADGEDLRTLINFRGKNTETGTMIKARSLDPYRYAFGQTLHDGSGDIVVNHWNEDVQVLTPTAPSGPATSPMRMNALTGALSDMGEQLARPCLRTG